MLVHKETDNSAGLYDLVNFYRIKEAEISSAKAKDIIRLYGADISAKNSLPQTGENVNTNVQKSEEDARSGTAPEGQFSLRMAEDQEKIRQSLGMRAKVDQSTLEANTDFESVERDLRRQVRAQAAEIRRLKAGGHAVDLNAVRKSAIALRSEYASGIKVDKLQQMMADAFDTILNEPELTQDAIDATLQPIAEAVLNESKYRQPEISEDSRTVLDEYVAQGQPIANVGESGNAKGAHLHFEVRYNGVKQNPMQFVTIP